MFMSGNSGDDRRSSKSVNSNNSNKVTFTY